jgi:hypothetical protein
MGDTQMMTFTMVMVALVAMTLVVLHRLHAKSSKQRVVLSDKQFTQLKHTVLTTAGRQYS